MVRRGGALVAAAALAVATALPGCSSTGRSDDASAEPSATLAIRGLRIRNELPYAVTDVLVTVPATGAFAGCSNVLARTECSTSFRSMAYRGNPMVVTWKERGKPQHTDEFVVKEPEDALPGADTRLDVSIFAPGQAGAKLAPFESENPER
ncbi:MAG: hypothetical protein PVJ17_16660 [Lysobacterales bacterium]|jgi:hypothetical protein